MHELFSIALTKDVHHQRTQPDREGARLWRHRGHRREVYRSCVCKEKRGADGKEYKKRRCPLKRKTGACEAQGSAYNREDEALQARGHMLGAHAYLHYTVNLRTCRIATTSFKSNIGSDVASSNSVNAGRADAA